MVTMSLPIHTLRKRLQELIRVSKRGYMATLASLSGVPDGTINRIAFGKQTTVTYKVWKQLHDADSELPPPPTIQQGTPEQLGVNQEGLLFVTALQHFFPIDAKFKSPEDLAASVGMKAKDIRSLLKGDFRVMPNIQEQKHVSSAFGMRLDEFIGEGKRILSEGKGGLHKLEILTKMYDVESVTTTHPDIVQIVVMAEKLDPDKIRIVKDLTLRLLVAQMNDEHLETL